MAVDDRAQIPDLVELAHDKSEQGRALLVENITDLFLSPEGRLNDHERALMNDILCKLIEDIEAKVRRELSARLAELEDVPAGLVKMLANDEISIARHILEKSPVLKDAELIEIVKHRTEEHRMSIALRQRVSEDVSDALVEYGEVDVIEALLKNADAEISERAMEYLVSESRRVDRFQEPLVMRADLPPVLAHRLYWWVSAAMRRHILTHFDADEFVVDAAVEEATKRALSDETQAESVSGRAQRLVYRLLQSGDLNMMFLIQALRQQRVPVFVAGLAELASVGANTVRRVISDAGGESLALLAKAIGMERNDFSTIYLLVLQARAGGAPTDPADLKKCLVLFDGIVQEKARNVLNYWERDKDYLVAIEELDAALTG